MKRLSKWLLSESRPLRMLLFGLFAYSLLILFCAIALDYHSPPAYYPPDEEYLASTLFKEKEPLDYRPYFKKLNWALYPLFFLIVGAVVRHTWKPFEEAWERAGNTPDSIIKDSSDKAIGKKQTEALISRLNKHRNWCLGIGLIASGIMWFFDSAETRHILLC